MSEGIGGKGGENEDANAKSEENEGASDKSEKNVCAGVLHIQKCPIHWRSYTKIFQIEFFNILTYSGFLLISTIKISVSDCNAL